MRVAERIPVNKSTSTFRLVTNFAFQDKKIRPAVYNGSQEKVRNLKKWYSELANIGRHYLLYSKAFPLIKRQYTICCSIVPNVYEALINMADC